MYTNGWIWTLDMTPGYPNPSEAKDTHQNSGDFLICVPTSSSIEFNILWLQWCENYVDEQTNV